MTSYSGLMQVFMSDKPGSAFHSNLSCHRLLIATHSVLELDLAIVRVPRPCVVCYPSYPQIRVAHLRCEKCNGKLVYPCSHNGGVRVIVPIHSLSHVRTKYVWPENAHSYDLAPTALRV